MTVLQFLQTKLSKFDIEVDQGELEILFLESDTKLTTEVDSTSVLVEAKKALVTFIPELLLKPEISEGEFKIKFDREGIKEYYKLLCNELGIPIDGGSANTDTGITYIGDRW